MLSLENFIKFPYQGSGRYTLIIENCEIQFIKIEWNPRPCCHQQWPLLPIVHLSQKPHVVNINIKWVPEGCDFRFRYNYFKISVRYLQNKKNSHLPAFLCPKSANIYSIFTDSVEKIGRFPCSFLLGTPLPHKGASYSDCILHQYFLSLRGKGGIQHFVYVNFV